jgi:hypothetical protein
MALENPAEHCAALVKQRDPVRHVTALFAPEDRRRLLLALYALDAEIVHIRDVVREEMILAIRHQWWRDAIDALPGATRGHPVLAELSHLLVAGPLDKADLIALIDAREDGMEPAITEGRVLALAARILGDDGGGNDLAMLAGAALVTRSRDMLTEARKLWRNERIARRAQLPAYLPATFVDARHPVTPLALYWRTLWMALRNRF